MAAMKLLGSKYETQKNIPAGFVVIGAGLPRTGNEKFEFEKPKLMIFKETTSLC